MAPRLPGQERQLRDGGGRGACHFRLEIEFRLVAEALACTAPVEAILATAEAAERHFVVVLLGAHRIGFEELGGRRAEANGGAELKR